MTLIRPLVHALSLADGSATMIPTSATLLRAQSFIDGRGDFSAGPAFRARFEPPATPPPDRYIFHVGFCGSTLLSRLLDQPGRALVLREPNCLADLANQAPAVSHPSADAALATLRAHLREPWQNGEAVVVKPSNWVNVLLPVFAAQTAPMRPLFLTIDRAAFVRAVVRGGPERTQFVARAAVHLSNADPAFPPLVADALAAHGEDAAKLLALAAVAHELQLRAMRDAARHWPGSSWLTLEDLMADPLEAACAAATTLGLSLDPAQLESDCRLWSGRHAKAPGSGYSAHAEADASDAIDADLGGLIDPVLAWAAARFDG